MKQPVGEAFWGHIEAPKWQPNRTAWLLTCVDLTSLLVGFFVLLFSTQTLERDKWQAVTGSFQAQFASKMTVVAAVPDGVDNAVVRVTGVKSGLGYLDTLLHQRLAGDVAWATLEADLSKIGKDMTYAVPAGMQDMKTAGVGEAWARLGGAVRGWKNPVGVRVVTTRDSAVAAASQAFALAEKLADSGVNGTFAEVTITDGGPQVVQLVVRAQ